MTRIIDKIINRRKQQKRARNQIQELNGHENNSNTLSSAHGAYSPYYSLEFFPPKTEAGLDNLLTRIDRMSHKIDPLFIDVTWGAGGSTAARTLSLAGHSQRYLGVDVLMHLTCTDMTRAQIKNVLDQAKSNGIQNILALRGDPPKGGRWNESVEAQEFAKGVELKRAIDLVKLLRELHGDYFGIGVAGHPEGHPLSSSEQDEFLHLKEKIDAGADFILTQFFYDAHVFIDYVKKCRSAGITCPIIPGIMPIQSYSTFKRMTDFCDIKVPQEVLDRLQPVKEDDEAVKEIGYDIAKSMCERILSSPDIDVDGIHFYTLNLERSVTRIMIAMGAFKEESRPQSRQFPWKSSALEKRSTQEEVRPINWANRPKSYVMRTDDWDEFPNGRWGDSTSPAFGELSSLSHFYSNLNTVSEDDRRAYLGEHPSTYQDIYNVFSQYILGSIPYLPWCESRLQPESFTIQNQLSDLNKKGFLTINSQPSVNGVKSDHPTFGWGGPGGYVYQKAYIECFVHPDKAKLLVDMITHKYPSMNLYAVNNIGDEMRAGIGLGWDGDAKVDTVTALTWGVFPHREIIQPTIFDPSTFLVWAEEAFSLWDSAWLNLYDFGSYSFELIENVRDTFYLVAIVDNDFMDDGKLFQALLEVGDAS